MKSRLIFKVEKNIGTLPDISYKCIFERELPIPVECFEHAYDPSIEDVLKALSFLFPDHRVLVICE